MMTKDEALKILLDSVNGDCYVGQDRERSLVKIIREALEHPAQEPDSRKFRHTEIPVAYTNAEELNELKSGMTTCYMYAQKIDDDDIALYTHR